MNNANEGEKMKNEIANQIKETISAGIQECYANYAEQLLTMKAKVKEVSIKDAYIMLAEYSKKHTDMIFTSNNTQILEQMEKEAVKHIDSIAKKVESKLKDEVKTAELIQLSNSYGSWLINGEKTFSFENIIAGGYNIQRLHTRQIYKYK